MNKIDISVAVISVIIASLISTGLLMLVLGAVHSFIPAIPALGFGQTLLVSILVNIIANKFKRIDERV